MNKYTSNTGRKIYTYSVHIKCIFSHWKADRRWTGERSENRTCRKKAGGKCVCGRRTDSEWKMSASGRDSEPAGDICLP